jgi:putative transcriptional regulator
MSAKMQRAKAKKEEHASDETFGAIMESFGQALEHARGQRHDLRTTRLELPPAPKPLSADEIAGIRRRLNYSQAVFARVLNVSTKTVQGWEQGVREPSDAALKLLSIADKHPDILLEA